MAESARPCRYCIADWAPTEVSAEECEMRHRDDPRVYDLARSLAIVLQDRAPSDQQIAWFLADADQVVDGFDPAPTRWKVRRLPASSNDHYDGIEVRLRINDVTYVALEGGKDCPGDMLPLAEFRRQEKEASRG
jgi:hypothetical protein